MNRSIFPRSEKALLVAGRAGALVLAICMLALIGCGSTKVYTADKTMIYRDSLYNMSNVNQVASRVEGELPDGEKMDMKGMDKKSVNALLKEHESIVVGTYIDIDDREMVYQRGRVEKYSQFSSLIKNHERAMKDISKFMADKKKTQLKLR